MNNLQKYLSTCLFTATALIVGASPAWAQGTPPPPPPGTAQSLGTASTFAVLSAAPDGGGAVTCTDSTIIGDVGSSGARPSVVKTRCTISGAIIAPVSAGVLTDFNEAYDAFAALSCTQTLTGTLAGLTLTPGIYCVSAEAKTGVLTLDAQGATNAVWIFLVDGALTGTNFTVLLANGATACNVYWWAKAAATMTTSDFKGTILAGAAITTTGGTFEGRALAKAAVTLTGTAFVGCEGGSHGGPAKAKCNQGVGNGPENCDPGNSNQDGHNSNPFLGSPRTNDELGGLPGAPGRKGGNK